MLDHIDILGGESGTVFFIRAIKAVKVFSISPCLPLHPSPDREDSLSSAIRARWARWQELRNLSATNTGAQIAALSGTDFCSVYRKSVNVTEVSANRNAR